ncbi:MAG TPA: DUF1634 domain-containing protein [Terracidiphilus sp.]|nr:DUF1634 domain-containing protein [Terracidiphilus sp.]
MNDQRLEIIIGNLLRAGVLLAAVIVFAGGVLYMAHDHAHHVDYHAFMPGGDSTRTLPGIVNSAFQLNSEGLMQLGLVLLIATPVARVAFAVVGFALERDRMYTVVSLIVLAILAYSLLHAT